jgi:hypothetical protein
MPSSGGLIRSSAESRYALPQKQHALELQEKVAERTAKLEAANAALRGNKPGRRG